MKKNTYAISGSHGFIGNALKTTLESQGHKVVPIPRELLFKQEALAFLFFSEEVTHIIHCAAYGNHYIQNKEDEIVKAQYFAGYNMLKASRAIDYKCFVNFSSSSVLLEHQTFYSATKAGVENLCRAFAQEYKKPIITVRPSTVIGVGEQETHLIPTLIRSCIDGTEMPFVGEPTHDFIAINDLTRIVLALADMPKHDKFVYNVSAMNSLKNEAIKELVEKYAGKKANIKRVESMRSYDNKYWIVHNGDIRELGLLPKERIDDTIRDMVNEYATRVKTNSN